MQQVNGKTKYSDSELQEFKAVIDRKLTETREEVSALSASLASTNGTSATRGDSAITSEKEDLNQQISRAQKFIGKLEAALVRIGNKTYGICVETGQLIPKGRLLSVPHTTKCMEAKLKQVA